MPQKDNTLLQELVEKYVKLFAKLAYNNGVPYDDAEDVAMEAIWAFYRSRHYGKLSETETKLMMARIVKRKSIDFYRKVKNERELTISSADAELYSISAPRESEPEERLIDREEAKRILDTLDNLRPVWREAVIMYCIEGCSYAEISEALGISETLCRSRISRAKKFLEEEFKDRLR